MTLEDVLQRIAGAAGSDRDKGARFEALMRRYFLTSKKYRTLVRDVWLWSDFPYREELGGQDTGIDLVILDNEGSYWAVQCKFYGETTYVSKGDVDTFLATAGRSFHDNRGRRQDFSQLLFISTSDKLSANAEKALAGQRTPTAILFPGQLSADTSVDWEKLLAGQAGEAAMTAQTFEPRSYQKEAIEKAHTYFQNHDRGKLIMACGTGKTYTALCIAEAETNRRGLVLVCVPSIALVNQILNDWTGAADCPIYPVCVCSDAGAAKRRDQDASDLSDLHFPACTDPDRVAANLRACLAKERESEADHGLVVLFTTYQSIDVVKQAQDLLRGEMDTASLFARPALRQKAAPRIAAETAASDAYRDRYSGLFDLIVCDEAHRTTGVIIPGSDESSFVKIHDNTFIRGKKRLYMTATPRIYTADSKKKAKDADAVLCSMDDETVYGEEIYRIGFGEAVERGILSDYKVLVLTIHEDALPDKLLTFMDKDKELDMDAAGKLVGTLSALSKRVSPRYGLLAADPAPMHKAVAFCSTIAKSKKITDIFNKFSSRYINLLPEEQRAGLIGITADHVDGSMTSAHRQKCLQWLREAREDERKCRVLTNVRCLSEGVDVPSLDGIIFLSARSSQVDIVQSVGRIMRKAPGKKYGYVIIPVMVSPQSDPETVLEKSKDFGIIWSVLQALRSHDDRFNAEVNKLKFTLDKGELPDDPTLLIGPGIPGGSGDDSDAPLTQDVLFDTRLEHVIYVKMVEKVGDRHYWEQWAHDIADIARRHTDRIRRLVGKSGPYRSAFAAFVKSVQDNLNPSIDEDAAMAMISQHLITRPVFQALFDSAAFLADNPVSQAMEAFLALLDKTSYGEDQKQLESFYRSVRLRCEGIDTAEGRQSVIAELYGTFFKTALARDVERLGIVYTPVEVVDFINQSAADILKKEFHRTLSDEGVHIIDPFTGTGTFLARLIQQGLITKDALPRKYRSELHANEIMLLAYYIASVNIESAWHTAMGRTAYEPFPGICLTDTFQLYEKDAAEKAELKQMDDPYLSKNSARAEAQRTQPMMVIVGNPPYSAKQKSANDNAQNESYPALEGRISETYAVGTTVSNKNSLYDSYIKAFRWASDRLGEQGGLIAFVTNAGWLDGQAMDGMRKCFEEEFSSIYVYNLRGNQRTKGELSRKEGGKIFGSGSRAAIAITILVKNPARKGEKAVIYYRAVEDYLTREEKLAQVKAMKSAASPRFTQKVLHPNEYGDWLNQRSDAFPSFFALGNKKDKEDKSLTFFAPYYSNGLATNRDPWCYNFSKLKVEQNIQITVEFYNNTLYDFLHKKENKTFEFPMDSKKINWNSSSQNYLIRKLPWMFSKDKLVSCLYRPFCREWLYYDRLLNHRTFQIPKLFPTGRENNLIICVDGIGCTEAGLPLMINTIPNVQILQNCQCFPLYWYEARAEQGDLFSGEAGPAFVRRDGVTDEVLRRARTQYRTEGISKRDIFYYVYGFLHSPEYRTAFAADLTKSLPRIPLVERYDDFTAFAEAGRRLARLHIDYENQPAPAGVAVERDEKAANRRDAASLYQVRKMAFGKKDGKPDKSVIIYNDCFTVTCIPPEAYDYVVNGRSPAEWIMERYQVSVDKASGIANDPNDWAREHQDPSYILRLLLSVMTVSIETMKIIAGLPKIDFPK